MGPYHMRKLHQPMVRFGMRKWRVLIGVALACGFIAISPAPADNLSGAKNSTALPADYWRFPLAPQGHAPENWSEEERSLAPQSCGLCHADKYEEWKTSFHAQAFSPGLVGQLLTYNADQTATCMKCHAPLFEQGQAFEAARAAGAGHQPQAQGLAATGNGCGGCHLRGRRLYGPPERDSGATGPSNSAAPHGGVYRSPDFEKPEFCGTCHQFPQRFAINGKPLENVVVEWRNSPFAARGITCQKCHMPDRRHLWRGIHDPPTVAAGLTARFEVDDKAARFELTNSGVGHAFPTYVTPKVVMRAVALNESGAAYPETPDTPDIVASYTIQRVVAFVDGRWVEHSDSRLLPGKTAILNLPWGQSRRIRMWLEVEPDDFYDHQVYDGLLEGMAPESAAARLIGQADKQASASGYRLFETELMRPD
jgi:hypothetical protein